MDKFPDLPGHTCPQIDKAQRALNRLHFRAKHGPRGDEDEVRQEGMAALEMIREENTQMRAAYREMRKLLQNS